MPFFVSPNLSKYLDKGEAASTYLPQTEVVAAPEANKVLRLQPDGKLPTSLAGATGATGDAASVLSRVPGAAPGNLPILDANGRVPDAALLAGKDRNAYEIDAMLWGLL